MVTVLNFDATSQTFSATHIVMAQQITRVEAILAKIQEHLGLPPIPPTLPVALAPIESSTDPGPTVPPTASVALLADHPVVPSQDENEVLPPALT